MKLLLLKKAQFGRLRSGLITEILKVKTRRFYPGQPDRIVLISDEEKRKLKIKVGKK